jgi:hypothetical protein
MAEHRPMQGRPQHRQIEHVHCAVLFKEMGVVVDGPWQGLKITAILAHALHPYRKATRSIPIGPRAATKKLSINQNRNEK